MNLLMLNNKIFNLVFLALRKVYIGSPNVGKMSPRPSRNGISMRKQNGILGSLLMIRGICMPQSIPQTVMPSAAVLLH
jgi:hypothetical protein